LTNQVHPDELGAAENPQPRCIAWFHPNPCDAISVLSDAILLTPNAQTRLTYSGGRTDPPRGMGLPPSVSGN